MQTRPQTSKYHFWKVKSFGATTPGLKNVALLFLISIFPLALTSFIWIDVVRGVASRAIDGSGHYAIGQIYDASIFPDTFGWTSAYFSGMPFPNFYPPLFFIFVSLIHHTHLFSYPTAFKLVASVPLLLMPAAFWLLAWYHLNKNVGVAFGVAVAAMTLCTLGEAFQASTGLDVSSTLIDGFYTQPLGFLLLLLWILFYLIPKQNIVQFVLCSFLLALTVLANFFNAITAILLIACVLAFDIVRWARESRPELRPDLKRTFLSHLLSPWIALALTAFWIVPMLTTYQYLVTRPLIRPLTVLAGTPIWCWYFLAVIGSVFWFKDRKGTLGPYLLTCFILLAGITFAGSFAPTWFPLQVFRFFSTINFLFCIPVGISLAYVTNLYLAKRPDRTSSKEQATTPPVSKNKTIMVVVLTIAGLLGLGFIMSTKKLKDAFVFYNADNYKKIEGVLDFARTHRDGMYLVEVLQSRTRKSVVRADSLALNAYLGSQGNEVVSIVYREASPNSSFFNAQLNAFSIYRENFGISSALLDDLDFIDQPLNQHIKRLQFIGVNYLVIATPEMKDKLSREPEIGARHDIGDWSIFELRRPALPQVRTLAYRPALVITKFTTKLRRQNDSDFIRLAEEQFNDAWFDVLLVRSAESKIDRLEKLDNFGALVIDEYHAENEDKAFSLLKDFAKLHTLILLSDDSSLFSRIQSSISDFPHASIVQRPNLSAGSWIDALEPTAHYNSSTIRGVWRSIKTILDKEKIPVPAVRLQAMKSPSEIQLSPFNQPLQTEIPVLLAQTYYPKWRRLDGEPLYAATPFFTLTFVKNSTTIVFARDYFDRLALWFSLGVLTILSLVIAAKLISRLRVSKADPVMKIS